MSDYKWTNEEVATKIDWEGGAEEGLRWGIRHTMIQDELLSHEWRVLEEKFALYEDQRDRVMALLPEPGYDPE